MDPIYAIIYSKQRYPSPPASPRRRMREGASLPEGEGSTKRKKIILKSKKQHKHRKGNWLFKKFFEKMGLLEAETVAWFAERIILAGVCIAAASFAAGILFTLYLAQPIAESQIYIAFSAKTEEVKEQIIDLTSSLFAKLIQENRGPDLKLAQLALRKQQLKSYLATKNSPFATDDATLDALVNSKNMKLILAISFVESNFGKHCYYYNCSGIGGSAPNLRKYKSYADWIRDFDNLLEQRYQGLPPEKFIGLYVQPGSPNWIYGVKQILSEINKLGIA